MESILKKIIIAKEKEVKAAKEQCPFSVLLEKIGKTGIERRSFLENISAKGKVNCIGELKKASPLKGVLRKDLDLAKTACLYESAGVKALSVLTDVFFQGKISDIKKVRAAVTLPVLRKDFIIDEYQVFESFLAGADAVLLIAAILSRKKLSDLLDMTHSLGMDALVEIHDEIDLKKIDFNRAKIIGINNRNLKSFSVDLRTTQRLLPKIPADKVIVSESGISSRSDVLFLKKLGVRAMLIGEGIVSVPDMRSRIKYLLGRRK
ncbi:MAG: indole-3-glycerol phosphate synthase TrpC [Candidatus Omnitrophica bacterium]|nr:indole-3-glycerol phosphate synthase TrpC [Candidatus Omnitrophota bacterium]MBU4479471.1 indole-3-glycerol phosphate synthase TrpC [Candidatus Omnitrophota bacterium]